MKWLFLLPAIIIFSINSMAAITRHALIIAIGDYPSSNGWPKLCSKTDADYIKKTFEKQDFQDIRIVADSAATVSGISKAFEQLIDKSVAGDIVVIHFSCHGEQVKAMDPNKLGGLDQCIVTYNALLPKLSRDFEKDQGEYFRGQAIGNYLLKLRKKLGKNGDVLILMDYCHSGAGTRGIGKKRGGEDPFIPEGNTVVKKQIQMTSDFYSNNIRSKNNEDSLATFVAISATRPEEFDLETLDDDKHEVGSLTYAVTKSFESLDTGVTYRFLFSKIQSVMNRKVPGQHPMIEGNGVDRKIFGGNYVKQKPYFQISRINKDKIIIKGGMLAGFDSGAKVSVYIAGTTDPSKSTEVNTGIVIAANNFEATVKLDKKSVIEKPVDGWVFLTEPVYHIKPVSIKIESRKNTDGFSDNDVSRIKHCLVEIPLVIYDDNPELLIVKGVKEDSILLACNGLLLDTISGIAQNPARLKAKIQDYVRYKFVKNIELKIEDANIDFKLIPVVNGIADTANIKYRMVGGIYEFHCSDTIKILVKNNGKKAIYINILDLQPNGVINPILPKASRRIYPADLKIKAGEEHLFDAYAIRILPPYGAEIFKVFVSNQEIDMEGLATKDEARAADGNTGVRGNLSVMEQLFKKSNEITTRGLEMYREEKTDGTTYNVLFNIVP